MKICSVVLKLFHAYRWTRGINRCSTGCQTHIETKLSYCEHRQVPGQKQSPIIYRVVGPTARASISLNAALDNKKSSPPVCQNSITTNNTKLFPDIMTKTVVCVKILRTDFYSYITCLHYSKLMMMM
jgi:hypothetical protein